MVVKDMGFSFHWIWNKGASENWVNSATLLAMLIGDIVTLATFSLECVYVFMLLAW